LGQFSDWGALSQHLGLDLNKYNSGGEYNTCLQSVYNYLAIGYSATLAIYRPSDGNTRTMAIAMQDGGIYWSLYSGDPSSYQYGPYYMEGDVVSFSFSITWPTTPLGWLALDDQGSIYQGSIQPSSSSSSVYTFSSSSVGALPSGVSSSAVNNLRFDGTNYLITLQGLPATSLYQSTDLVIWNDWSQGLPLSNLTVKNSYFDGTRWWLILTDNSGQGQTLYYRLPTDSLWSQASGYGVPPWSAACVLSFNGMYLLGEDQTGYGSSNLWYSTDGMSFNSYAVGVDTNTYLPVSLATNGTNLLVASSNSYTYGVLYSSDGINWSPSASWDSVSGSGPNTLVGDAVPGGVLFDGTYFYASVSTASSGPYLYRSIDGTSWSSFGISGVVNGVNLEGLWYDQGVYAVFDAVAGVVKVSVDGLNFSNLPHPISDRTFIQAYPQAVILNWD
jgi:hypothetical protein